MPNAYVVNKRPFHNGAASSTYGEALSLLVEMLVSAGWTIQGSGDGLSGFNATGKVFTSTGNVAAGWNNSRAWVRVRDPAGVREFLFQLGPNSSTTNGTIRIKYSANAKFTGGTPSATVCPSAPDERVLWGAGTDATPTPGAWFNTIAATSYGGALVATQTTTGTQIFQGAAMSDPPYGFWFAQMSEGKTKGAGILFDPVISVPEDTDPCVIAMGGTGGASFLMATTAFLCRDGNTAATWATTQTGILEGTWAHVDAGRTLFLPVQPGGFAANVGANLLAATQQIVMMVGAGGLTINPFNGKHEGLPVAWMRASTAAQQPGLKGWSTMARWATTYQITTTPAGNSSVKNMFQESLDDRKWISVGAFWLPWDGTSTALS